MLNIKPKPINTYQTQGCNQTEFILVIKNGNYTSPVTVITVICNWIITVNYFDKL